MREIMFRGKMDDGEGMTAEDAIKWFENRIKNITMPGARRMYAMALNALYAQQERENPDPLTPEELLESNGGGK